MARDKFAERLRAARVSAIELVQDYARLAETVTPEALPAPVIARDPDDDHVLACALCAKAQLIVSGDSHLLDLKAPIRASQSALPRLRSARASQHRNNQPTALKPEPPQSGKCGSRAVGEC